LILINSGLNKWYFSTYLDQSIGTHTIDVVIKALLSAAEALPTTENNNVNTKSYNFLDG